MYLRSEALLLLRDGCDDPMTLREALKASLEREVAALQDDLMERARETRDEVHRAARDGFQARHPHYHPPRWATESIWREWGRAMVAKCGLDYCLARFPEKADLFR